MGPRAFEHSILHPAASIDYSHLMDFLIIANAWSAGKDNPTSKHRIALELVRQGHRVLWIEGSGMRTPSVGSSSDRLRMLRKVAAAFRGAREEKSIPREGAKDAKRDEPASAAGGKRTSSSPSSRLRATISSLWILSPLFIPLPKYEFIRRLNGLICRWSMKFWGWRLGFRDPVLINYVPVLAEAMRGRERQDAGCRMQDAGNPASSNQHPESGRLAPRVVYHCVDRWDAFSMYDSAMMGEMDRRCCRYADVVIASAGELYDRCRAINPNTVLIPHGVDWEHFREAVTGCKMQDASHGMQDSRSNTQGSTSSVQHPASSIQHPIIGFFGLLSEWVDQELLLKLAAACPGADLQLIGKADVDVSRLKGVPNIKLPGPMPFARLPEALARFTVGIIPFVVNDLTRSVNPIKLREMLSAGCPVVSTDLPEVARYASQHPASSLQNPAPGIQNPSVQIAATHDEFIAAVRRLLDHPLTPDERLSLSDAMAGETWSAKVHEILKLVGGGSVN